MHRNRRAERKRHGHRVGIKLPEAAAWQEEPSPVDPSELEAYDEQVGAAASGKSTPQRDKRGPATNHGQAKARWASSDEFGEFRGRRRERLAPLGSEAAKPR